jgi:catechol 2,3-dioxygenase-like lactoylglutathione lyase family enzyme
LTRVYAKLREAGIPSALVGAGALAVYGVSRSTVDQDLLVTDRRALDRSLWASLRASVEVRVGDADDPLAGVVRISDAGERDVDVVVGRHRWQQECVQSATLVTSPPDPLQRYDPPYMPSVTGLVPMIHVADVERSADFYRHLGLEIGNYVPREGRKHWAWLYAPDAPDWKRGPNLMVTRSERPPAAAAQSFLMYLYVADLKALRVDLVTRGLAPGEIEYPDYLPDGEFCLKDPDGYLLMIAQSAADTP